MKSITSFPLLVTIVFLILKVVGVICWSWWWVFSPLWIAGGLLYLGILLVASAIFTPSKKREIIK